MNPSYSEINLFRGGPIRDHFIQLLERAKQIINDLDGTTPIHESDLTNSLKQQFGTEHMLYVDKKDRRVEKADNGPGNTKRYLVSYAFGGDSQYFTYTPSIRTVGAVHDGSFVISSTEGRIGFMLAPSNFDADWFEQSIESYGKQLFVSLLDMQKDLLDFDQNLTEEVRQLVSKRRKELAEEREFLDKLNRRKS